MMLLFIISSLMLIGIIISISRRKESWMIVPTTNGWCLFSPINELMGFCWESASATTNQWGQLILSIINFYPTWDQAGWQIELVFEGLIVWLILIPRSQILNFRTYPWIRLFGFFYYTLFYNICFCVAKNMYIQDLHAQVVFYLVISDSNKHMNKWNNMM